MISTLVKDVPRDTVLSSNLQELSGNDNPPPAWSEQAGSVYVTFLPQVTPQVPDKPKSRLQKYRDSEGA
ncbi:MAG: hypothetical protein LWX51_08030 [Deltaproteobacteria bacterium]|nr:hypothetical protein [Deltaproteobacteria bacterium]